MLKLVIWEEGLNTDALIAYVCYKDTYLSAFQRKSVTESPTSVTTWTWTTQAARAAPVFPDTLPAALELKRTLTNTATQQKSFLWRRVSSEQRNVSAQQSATTAPARLGLTHAAKLEQMTKSGKRKVRGFLYYKCITNPVVKCKHLFQLQYMSRIAAVHRTYVLYEFMPQLLFVFQSPICH